MTKVDAKIFGRKVRVELRPADILLSAIDDFLISDTPDLLFSALIKLSISLERYLKEYLEKKNSDLIWAAVGWKTACKELDQILFGTSNLKQKRNKILSYFKKKVPENPNKTIDFSIALLLFPHFYRVSKKNIKDFDDLRNYRNGLFHWKADEKNAFELAKQTLRIIEWQLKFIEKQQGWWLGGDFNIVDPMGEKREFLKHLRKSIRSENAFNVQRRIFRHRRQSTLVFQSEARLKGLVTIPEAIVWQQRCPACGYLEMKLYEIGNIKDGRRVNKDVAVWCERCDLKLTGTEFVAIRPSQSLSLRLVYEKIKSAKSE